MSPQGQDGGWIFPFCPGVVETLSHDLRDCLDTVEALVLAGIPSNLISVHSVPFLSWLEQDARRPRVQASVLLLATVVDLCLVDSLNTHPVTLISYM
ncbi:hypothetical protein V6N12_030927 [Hibiscus sabdariffa]|uniref:Uncharacterized protein n=1 Tax=Hibiscus sabdariffa TaxID=183260 RepID=A0ABR2E7H5_9ROSI